MQQAVLGLFLQRTHVQGHIMHREAFFTKPNEIPVIFLFYICNTEVFLSILTLLYFSVFAPVPYSFRICLHQSIRKKRRNVLMSILSASTCPKLDLLKAKLPG